jgi:hypothetical protein
LNARTQKIIALGAIGVLTFVALLLTEKPVGFTRDESFYFLAADLYTPWYLGLWDNFWHGRILDSFSDSALTRAFSYNTEHPVLMKSLFGLSHWLFFSKLAWLRPAAAYRAPAWALGGLMSVLITLLSRRAKLSWGLTTFAVLCFWLTPRNLYDGHLAAFDMPIAVAWVLVVYAYDRGFQSLRWAVLTGVFFGLALCIKHNAYFYPVAFLIHWLLVFVPKAYREGKLRGVLKSVPRQWGFMALLGPLIFFLHWPYLWPHPIDRLGAYFGFHLHHVNYPWTYLGTVLREPPFPLSYVLVVTALTVPLPLFALMVTGVLRATVALVRQWRTGLDGFTLLVLLNGITPLLLISWPSVPHFGGTKHWLPGMPFLGILAAASLQSIAWTVARLLGRIQWERYVLAALGGLALLCALVGTVHIDGYGDSAYNELAGEGAGAAQLGMQRQFWSNNVSGVLDFLNRTVPRGDRVQFHEVTSGSYQAYLANGMLRPDIGFTLSPNDAHFAAYQYMQEFRDQEFEIWNAFGTDEPVDGLYLDESPNVTVYRRPGF